ncbi:MAG: hypothetical protein JWP29_5405 [Rhodoferax sp.]|nr:hypothetical protein [Rhodoferax sp.]
MALVCLWAGWTVPQGARWMLLLAGWAVLLLNVVGRTRALVQ